jgi:phosphate-selective porin OprO/OprP
MKKPIFILAIALLSTVFANAQTAECWVSNHQITYGGRIMYDMAIWGAEEFDNTGSEIRRVRLYSSGTMYSNVKYKLQLDFAGGKIAFKDVWMELNKLPIQGNVKIGHFKEPLRLEGLTSSKYITFMERGLPIAMTPERNTGAMYHTIIGEKLSFQAGVFRKSNAFGNDKTANNNLNITSRATYLAMNDGDKLLHLGIANSRRKSNDKTYSFSSRAENHLGNNLMDVNYKNQVQNVNIIAGEVAFINGSLSLQGEALQTTINTEIGQWNTPITHEIMSYYGQVSYFLTGESRSYKSSLAGFGRVKPNNNYGENGWGALEVAARFSAINSQEDGSLEDITFGLNWYLNPNTRVMLNYVMGEMTKGTEVTVENAVMMRVQLDF